MINLALLAVVGLYLVYEGVSQFFQPVETIPCLMAVAVLLRAASIICGWKRWMWFNAALTLLIAGDVARQVVTTLPRQHVSRWKGHQLTSR